MRYFQRASLLAMLLLLSPSAIRLGAFHLGLIRSAPGASQALAVPPARLQLWFTEPPAAGVSQISLKRENVDVAVGETVVVAKDKSMYADPVKALAAGSYVIAWKTAGDDGHVLAGEIKFTIAPK
jgi:methionine-rich copper-binding protein CopC